MRKSSSGFTIVELLVVVVVIAILAAISTVAYTGIQTRAENTKTIAAMSQYIKALKVYAAQEGIYPAAGWSCLGTYPGNTCALHAGGTATCSGNGAVSSSSTFNTAMSTIFNGTTPQPSTQSLNCGGSQYRGAYYYAPTGVNPDVRYFLRGNQPCSGVPNFVTHTRYQANDATLCMGNIS